MSHDSALGLVALDASAPPRELFEQPAPHAHIVQFYEDEDFLYENVARFLLAGLNASDPVVVIATEAHRLAFTKRLKLNGCDVDAACANRRLVLLDARDTLSTFMVDGAPDWNKFATTIGGVIAQITEGRAGVTVRAYGEMVDLLWRDGDQQAAITLEGMWNDLGKQHSFSLLCAYVMGNFYKPGDADPFHQVCAAHSHVIPTEQYSALSGPDVRLREISQLQQRARSLEHELAARRVLEQALREALDRERILRAEAERSVRFNEMFAGMLGHDLRNPLGAIRMGANYIARTDPGEKTTRAANRIVSSAERMSRMIDQLLDFTRIRVGGGLALSHTRIDLAELCFKIKDELEAANPDSFINLETMGNTVGEWDYDRLLQVFSNLVGNAIAHGVAGCTVQIQADGNAATDVVAIIHNAGAVAPEILPVMFEPFRGSKQHKTQGLGMGLYITRQIIVAHGGTIEVSSDPQNGTTVRVQVPRKPPASGPAAR